MPFITQQDNTFSYSDPLAMYQDNKMKKIHGVLDYQAKMIDLYMKNYDKRVVALQLPTGCGKTLVGTIIGDFRRKKNKEKVVYLCPTNQLVYQVVDMAKNSYGIQATAFCGKQSDYVASDKASYTLKKAIAVTTYSSFFSFGKFFEDADVVIMDDVHSAEEYIVSNWSLSITREDQIYGQIVELLKSYISENAYSILVGEDNAFETKHWCDMVPMPLLFDVIEELHAILCAQYSEDPQYMFSWSRIAEHLRECNIFLSSSRILIRPWISPTLTHSPLSKAKQVILMSATLGESGELERVTGLTDIVRLPIVDGWDKRGVGRRFFIFPDLVFEGERWKIVSELQKQCKKSVVLVGYDSIEDVFRKNIKTIMPELMIMNSSDIRTGKNTYTSADEAMLILSNRFDGIDFADEVCRLLIIYDLPKVTNLQERFLVSVMAASSLYNERIRMRITQAVGRCTRNPSDYSIVCVVGSSLNNDLTKEERIRRFSPELRAEICLGLDNSYEFQSIEDILYQVEAFMNKTTEWNTMDNKIVSLREEYAKEEYLDDDKVDMTLEKASKYELEYQYALWSGNYEKSYNLGYQVVQSLSGRKLDGYRHFWEYLVGCSAYYLYREGRSEYRSKAKDFFERASKQANCVRWMHSLNNKLFNVNSENELDEDNFNECIIRIEEFFSNCSSAKKLEETIMNALKDLKSEDGLVFERGHQKVGELLGYVSINSVEDGAPDPIWYANPQMVVVAEDKIYKDNCISLSHVRETKGHVDWVRNKYPDLKNSEIILLLLSNTNEVDRKAVPEITDDIYYLNTEEFINWCNKALTMLLVCFKTYSYEGCSEWRESVHQKFLDAGITPKDYYALIRRQKLINLNSK